MHHPRALGAHVCVLVLWQTSTLMKGTKSLEVTFRLIPATFACSDAHLGSAEWLEFSKEFTRAQKLRVDGMGMLAKHCQKSMWLVKPAASRHGEGVQVRFGRSVGWRPAVHPKGCCCCFFHRSHVSALGSRSSGAGCLGACAADFY